MKSLQLGLFFLILSKFAAADILVWSPLFPTILDTITITYDATQGSAGLVGVSEVYAHTGVLTENSNNPADWKYVIAGWNQNIAKAKMKSLGNNKWLLKFHIQSYYGLPETEQVTNLAFVFRNADGSRTGKTTSGDDIFLPIYKDGLNIARLSPPSYHNILQCGDSLEIFAIASKSEKIDLLIDNILVQSCNSDTLRHVIHPNDYEKHRVRLQAAETTGTSKTDSFYYLLRPAAPMADLPANVRDGINYASDGDITLVLHAPHKEFVYLIGDWNNWEADPNFYLNKTADGERYWLTLDAQPNTSYRYQYLVDGALRIADPYAELVLDPWNDPDISASTFPDLMPYPENKTTEIVSVLSTTPSTFDWQAEDYQRPAKENLVIYELLLRDFLREHDFITLTDTLDYFAKLGLNAIELMPISEFEGNSSWGYNPSFYFAPDKYYGPKQDLQIFIDAAHKRGLAVIQDIVLNHTYGQSPMVRLYLENLSKSPWYNITSPNPVFSWGYDFNHERLATQEFVDRVTEFWLTEYKVDGFRFDFTKGFTNKPGDGSGRDDSRIVILKRMADAIWAVDPSAFVILEHFADNSEEKELAEYGMLIWGNANYNYNEATMGYHENGKSDFSWGSYKRRGWKTPHLVTYMESHDEERLMFKNKEYGAGSGSYNIKDEKTALERIAMAATFFFTIPGPKMFWQFGELGYDYSIDYNGRVGEKPIRWNYLYQTNRQKLHNVFSQLIHLKRRYATFSSTTFSTFFDSSVKWMKIDHDSMNVLIVGNFDIVERSRKIVFQHAGYWFDFFSGDTLFVAAEQQELILAPGEYHLYTDKHVDDPIPSGINMPKVEPPRSCRLDQNYPNPFNPTTTIRFELPVAAELSLEIYNLAGQKIKTLFNGDLLSGLHVVLWDGCDESGRTVAGGVYFCRLTTDSWSQTVKMLLIQ